MEELECITEKLVKRNGVVCMFADNAVMVWWC